MLYTNAVRRRHARPPSGLVGFTLFAEEKPMKRSHGTSELPVFRPLVPAASDDTETPVAPAPKEPGPVPSAEPNAADQAPMTFPGPFAYGPKPATMEDGDTKPVWQAAHQVDGRVLGKLS